jgi:hypothetical protein
MKSAILGLAASAVVLATAPNAALGARDRSYNLSTRIVEQAPSVGEYDGSLQLHVSAGGLVSGYYRPDADARFVPVTGGLSGTRLWLEIGIFSRRPLRFSGTFAGGRIDAQASGFVIDNGEYTGLDLIGTPKPS